MAQQVSWQDYKTVLVRSSLVLTNSYVAGTVLGVSTNDANQMKTADQIDQFNKLALEFDFTLGSLTNAQVKIEFSDDNVAFYQLQSSAISGGVDTITPALITLSATGKYYVDINAAYFQGGGFRTKYVRISASGTGTVTSSLLTITAVIGVA